MKNTNKTNINEISQKLDEVLALFREQNEQYITVHETAKLLGCCDQMVRNMIHSGEIPAEHTGRAYRIRKSFIYQKINC